MKRAVPRNTTSQSIINIDNEVRIFQVYYQPHFSPLVTKFKNLNVFELEVVFDYRDLQLQVVKNTHICLIADHLQILMSKHLFYSQ